MSIPIDESTLGHALERARIDHPGRASIRQIRLLVDALERETDVEFIRMEMGVPGLATPAVAVAAERTALADGVSSVYPPAAGIPVLKHEISRFVERFLGVTVAPSGCVPTVGSLGGSFMTFLLATSLRTGADTILFLDPGFPVHRQQARTLGIATRGFDFGNHRGPALRARLEEETADGRVAAILYSNPNNPSWMCLRPDELESIAVTARERDILIIEDLAYFGMDVREAYARPGVPPYQPSISHVTDQWVLLISSSKIFSYAGQRIGMLVASDVLAERDFPALSGRFSYTRFGEALVLGAVYAATAGVSHSAQYGLCALLRAANDGELSLRDETAVYPARAAVMKRLFLKSGFRIVYDVDGDRPIADGFYFTVAYGSLSGEALVGRLLRYGISVISLASASAVRSEGVRACVSLVRDEQLPELEARLRAFSGTEPA